MKLRAEQIIKTYDDRSVVKELFRSQSRRDSWTFSPNDRQNHYFYMIVGLIRPSSGLIYLDGDDITDHPMYVRARRVLVILLKNFRIS